MTHCSGNAKISEPPDAANEDNASNHNTIGSQQVLAATRAKDCEQNTLALNNKDSSSGLPVAPAFASDDVSKSYSKTSAQRSAGSET
eukprot:2613785-Amphidinium_carterae.1